MRSPLIDVRVAARKSIPSSGTVIGSRAYGPVITLSSSAASSTVFVSGPECTNGVWKKPLGRAAIGMRPQLPLNPHTPLNEAGMRIEPPPSEPCAMLHRLAPIAEALPPEEPPLLYPGLNGVLVAPKM